MRTFWNIIGVWFLAQLILMSVAVAAHSAQATNEGLTETQYDAQNTCSVPVLGAAFMAAIMPLTDVTIFEGEWCWEQF